MPTNAPKLKSEEETAPLGLVEAMQLLYSAMQSGDHPKAARILEDHLEGLHTKTGSSSMAATILLEHLPPARA